MKFQKNIIKKLGKRDNMPKDNEGGYDGLTDPNPHKSPMQTAQLIGSLVIRFVWHAQSGDPSWEAFPDKKLMDIILDNCRDRALAMQHLTALLYHESKILDLCGTPNKLRKLTMEAFPQTTQKMIEEGNIVEADWEIV